MTDIGGSFLGDTRPEIRQHGGFRQGSGVLKPSPNNELDSFCAAQTDKVYSKIVASRKSFGAFLSVLISVFDLLITVTSTYQNACLLVALIKHTCALQ